MDIPSFHPEWLVTLWLTTPGLNKLDPHLTLILAFVIIISFYFLKKRRAGLKQLDQEEEVFQRLLREKNMIEKRLENLEQENSQRLIPKEQYETKKKELEKNLNVAKKELCQFT